MICRKCKASIPANAVFCHLCGIKQEKPRRRSRTRANCLGTAYKRGDTWQAILRKTVVIEGKRTLKKYSKCGFPTRAAALAAAPLLDQQPEINAERTLQYYWELYRDGKMEQLSDSKQTAYRIAYAKLDELHHTPISTISVKVLQRVLDEKASTYYPARVIKALLSHIYKLAMVDGEAQANPASLLTLPKLEETEGDTFTEAEQKKLWKAYQAGDTFIGYILLMMYSGMMPGELFICRKKHIFWEHQYILGCGIKTKKRRNTPIVIADYLLPVLEALCEYSTGPKLLTMNRDNFYEESYLALERVGCRRITPYSSRHTVGTKLDVEQQTAPSVISEVLRQSTPRIQQRYKYPNVSDALKAVNALKPDHI